MKIGEAMYRNVGEQQAQEGSKDKDEDPKK